MEKTLSCLLIITDVEGVQQILSVYAELVGCELVALDKPAICDARNKADGNCSKESPCVDMLMIEQKLNGLCGLDFIQQQVERGCKLPSCCMAVMSRDLTNEELKKAKDIGCHVLQKPVTYEIFKNWVNGVKGNRIN